MESNALYCKAQFFVIFVALKRQLNHEEHEEKQKLVLRMPITLRLNIKKYVAPMKNLRDLCVLRGEMSFFRVNGYVSR